jgi:hypothetical protein
MVPDFFLFDISWVPDCMHKNGLIRACNGHQSGTFQSDINRLSYCYPIYFFYLLVFSIPIDINLSIPRCPIVKNFMYRYIIVINRLMLNFINL